MSVNIGIIGFGRIGAEHAGWLAAAEGVETTTVFDPTPARRELARSRGLKLADSMEAIFDDTTIDAVLIATPSAMHVEPAAASLMAGKHVMIEKPMALNLEQAKRLAYLAAERGRVLSVFHNRRWDIDYLTVKWAIEAGRFGKLINIESRISQWASCVGPAAKEYRPNWRNEATFGGGGLYDWGSHLLDQMWRLLWPARPVRVFAQLRGNVWSADCDDFARVCIDFDNGAVGLVEINTTTTRPLPRWRIDGVLGSADSPMDPFYDTQNWAKLQFLPADGSVESRLPPAEAGLSESAIWSQFCRAVQGEGAAAVPVETVLPTMLLLDAARASSATGTCIDVRSGCEWIY